MRLVRLFLVMFCSVFAVAQTANFSDSTPAPPSGNTNVKWQKDSGGNVSAYVPTSSGGGSGSGDATTLRGISLPTLAASTGFFYDSNGTLQLKTLAESDVANLTSDLAAKVDSTGSYANPSWITSLAWTKITGAPSFATVATSGSYTDLSNKPTIPSFASPTFTGTVTLPITGLTQCLHVGTTGIVSGTGSDCGSGGGGMANPMTTAGDLIVGGSGGTPGRQGLGSNGQYLGVRGGALGYFGLQASDVPNLAESQVTNLATDLAAKAPLASPTFTGTVTFPSGSVTECLHKSAAGVVTGTGSDCGSGGGTMNPLYVNVKDNGVKGDGVVLISMSWSSGGAVITSPTHTFVSGDVGKLASCQAGSGYKNSTIVSVSGLTATIASTFGSTVTGTGICTVATDDTAAIQALLNANCPATLSFPPGNYGVTASLTLPVPPAAQCSFKGAGAGISILDWLSTGAMNSPVIQGLSGSAANPYADVHINGLEFNLAAATGSYTVGMKALYIQHMLRADISQNFMHDCPATCIGVDFLRESSVQNNVAETCGRTNNGSQAGGACIGIAAGTDSNESSTIVGNTVRNGRRFGIFVEAASTTTVSNAAINITGNVVINDTAPMGEGIADAGVVGVVITGNRLYGLSSETTTNGISVDAGTVGLPGVLGVISNNTVYGWLHGINVLQPSTGSGANQSGYKVAGNHVYQSNSDGILITSASSTKVMDVDVSGNTVRTSGGAGILFNGAGSAGLNLTANANTLIDNGWTTANAWEQAGIAFTGTAASPVVRTNRAYDAGSTKQKYGLSFNTGLTLTGADVQLNSLAGNVTSAINNTATLSSGFIKDTGQAAPIASPAFTGTVTLPVTGATQCLHVDSSGSLSGTGSECGSGGGSGLGDPGSNGIVKRTALNTTAAAAYTDVVPLWGGGSCSGYLKSDGTCDAGSTGGLVTWNVRASATSTSISTGPYYLKHDGTLSSATIGVTNINAFAWVSPVSGTIANAYLNMYGSAGTGTMTLGIAIIDCGTSSACGSPVTISNTCSAIDWHTDASPEICAMTPAYALTKGHYILIQITPANVAGSPNLQFTGVEFAITGATN